MRWQTRGQDEGDPDPRRAIAERKELVVARTLIECHAIQSCVCLLLLGPLPSSIHPGAQTDGGAALRRRALALARGGLRLDPTSDWLWGCAATIAAAAASGPLGDDGGGGAAGSAERASAAATAEYCYSRALQLNPRRAPLWAALGRLYAAHGEGALASRCFDSARSHEPTSIAVWEAMGDAALRRAAGGAGGAAAGGSAAAAAGAVAASPAWRDAADAYEHAQLLGGDVESRLGFALGSLLLRHYGGSSSGGGGAEGAGAAAGGGVLAAATKAAAMQPLLPAAHHARGLALEARGDFAAAAEVRVRVLLPGLSIMVHTVRQPLATVLAL